MSVVLMFYYFDFSEQNIIMVSPSTIYKQVTIKLGNIYLCEIIDEYMYNGFTGHTYPESSSPLAHTVEHAKHSELLEWKFQGAWWWHDCMAGKTTLFYLCVWQLLCECHSTNVLNDISRTTQWKHECTSRWTVYCYNSPGWKIILVRSLRQWT